MKSSTQVKTTWRMCLEMENNGRVIWTFCINVLPLQKKKKRNWPCHFCDSENSLENLETSIVSLEFLHSQHVSMKSLFYLKHLISDWNKTNSSMFVSKTCAFSLIPHYHYKCHLDGIKSLLSILLLEAPS